MQPKIFNLYTKWLNEVVSLDAETKNSVVYGKILEFFSTNRILSKMNEYKTSEIEFYLKQKCEEFPMSVIENGAFQGICGHELSELYVYKFAFDDVLQILKSVQKETKLLDLFLILRRILHKMIVVCVSYDKLCSSCKIEEFDYELFVFEGKLLLVCKMCGDMHFLDGFVPFVGKFEDVKFLDSRNFDLYQNLANIRKTKS